MENSTNQTTKATQGGVKIKIFWTNSVMIYIWVFPKIGVPPKWMVYFMENPIKMDDLGGTLIFGKTHIQLPTNKMFDV